MMKRTDQTDKMLGQLIEPMAGSSPLEESSDRGCLTPSQPSRYRLEKLLGRQPGRRTFLAVDTCTQAQVVVKLLLFGPDFTWEDLKLFGRKAEMLKSLGRIAIS